MNPADAGREELNRRLREVCGERLPLPAAGNTAERHAALFRIGEEGLSLAKLAEAHFDALAILAEAGEEPVPGAIYAVWASEVPGQALQLQRASAGMSVRGSKPFCSGGLLVDRALVTVAAPEPLLAEIDLRAAANRVVMDGSRWQTEAFRGTETGAVTFADAPVDRVVGDANFYLERPGFWHGACGPAACWAGGAAGLLHFAQQSKRNDPHTVAHRAALETDVWAMRSLLASAGDEIDAAPHDLRAAHIRALRLRHVVEQLATDTLRRFARAYGPHPLAMDGDTGLRYLELDLFLRQCHAERDLEALGRATSPDA